MYKKYDFRNCPCPHSCNKHGSCKACMKAHHDKNQQTYCEFLVDGKVRKSEEIVDASEMKFIKAVDSKPSGKMIRLLDYGACAG